MSTGVGGDLQKREGRDAPAGTTTKVWVPGEPRRPCALTGYQLSPDSQLPVAQMPRMSS